MQIIRKKRQFPLLEIIYLIFDNHRTQQSNVFIQALEWLVIEKGALGPKGKVIVYYLHKGHHDFRDDQEFSTLMSILHKHMETANINTITAPEQVLEAIRASLQANHAGVAEYLAEFFDWTIFFSGALDLPSISSFFQIKIQNSPLINERGIFTTSSFSELDQYSIAPIRLLKHCPPGFPTFCEIPQYSPSRLLDLKRKYFSLPISSNDQKEFMWKLISGKPINEITKSTVDYSDFEGFGYVSSTPKVHPPFINHLLDKNDEKGTREKQAITPSKALAESEALEARGPAHPWIHHLLNYRWDFSNQLNLMEIVFEVICRTENGRKDEARWADILLPDKSAIYPQFHEFVSAKFHDSWSTIAGPMKPPHIAFEEKEFQLNPTYTHKKKSWKKKEKP